MDTMPYDPHAASSHMDASPKPPTPEREVDPILKLPTVILGESDETEVTDLEKDLEKEIDGEPMDVEGEPDAQPEETEEVENTTNSAITGSWDPGLSLSISREGWSRCTCRGWGEGWVQCFGFPGDRVSHI